MPHRKATIALPSLSLLIGLIGMGALTVRAVADDATAKDAPTKYTGLPYKGQPVAVPGIVQAEEYDIAPSAANGISFNYNSPARKNDLRTSPDSIGLARYGNGHVNIKGEPEKPDQAYVGWTQTGEWLKYTLHVNETGVYQLGAKLSAADKDAAISFSFPPGLTTGLLAIPTTAGYQPNVEVYHVWETLDNLAEVTLPKGDTVMTVKIEKGGGFNFDYFTLTKKP